MNTDQIKNLKRRIIQAHTKAVATGEFPAVIRAQVEVEVDLDPLHWLSAQSEHPKFFWRNDNGGRVLAYAGSVQIFTNSDRASSAQQWVTIRQWMEQVPSLRCWGGGAFHSRMTANEWSDFDAWAIYIPKIGLERDPVSAKWHLACQLVISAKEDIILEETLSLLDKSVYYENISEAMPEIISREELPSYDGWKELVKETLQALTAGEISKVVLARRLHLKLSRFIAPELVMSKLLPQTGSAFLFAPAPETAFLGVSPELLYHRNRDRLETFAVAGTNKRGQTEQEDRLLKESLAASDKDQLEHKQVVDVLTEKLRTLCVISKIDGEKKMLELANQRHFFQRLRGRILDGVNDEVIINSLHPTPAVGGSPTYEAVKYQLSKEPFDRGWFTGTIGWLSHNEAEMAVGIRSCLIRSSDWYIYGGAGILAGSEALAEWEEISLKMKNILDILSCC